MENVQKSKEVKTNTLGQRLKADGTVDKRSLWKKGQSGNPSGRPKGSKSAATELKRMIEGEALETLSNNMPQLIEKAVEMAMGGSESMLKFCIDRFVAKAAISEGDRDKGLGGIIINVQAMPETREVSSITIEPLEGEVIDG